MASKTLIYTITFDPEVVEASEIIDGLSELLHSFGEFYDLQPDDDTGGYIGFDWAITGDGREEIDNGGC